jgi:hypothetical protein
MKIITKIKKISAHNKWGLLGTLISNYMWDKERFLFLFEIATMRLESEWRIPKKYVTNVYVCVYDNLMN